MKLHAGKLGSIWCVLAALVVFLPGVCVGFVDEAQNEELSEQPSEDEVEIPVEDLFRQLERQLSISLNSGKGSYVVRRFSPSAAEKTQATIRQVQRQLAESKRRYLESVPNADPQAIDEQHAETIVELLGKLDAEVTTIYERYWVDGDHYRIERTKLNDNETPLDELSRQIGDGAIDLPDPRVMTWDGSRHAEIIPDAINGKSMSKLEFEQLASPPDFLELSRPVDLASARTNLAKAGASPQAWLRKRDGQIVLRIGSKESIGAFSEIVFDPSLGYAITMYENRIGGQRLSYGQYDDFIETDSGVSLPGRTYSELYKLDASQVPVLSTRRESVVVEPPQVNVPIDRSLIALAETEEFQRLRPLDSNPEELPEESPDINATVPGSTWGRWFVITNVVVVCAIAIWFVWRKRRLLGGSVILLMSVSLGCDGHPSVGPYLGEDIVLGRDGELLKPSEEMSVLQNGTSERVSFVVRSQADETLVVTRVRTSCGCSAGRMVKQQLVPGEATELSCHFSVSGSAEKTVTLTLETSHGNYRVPFIVTPVHQPDADEAMFTREELRFDEIEWSRTEPVTFREPIELGVDADPTTFLPKATAGLRCDLVTIDGQVFVEGELLSPPVGAIAEEIRLMSADDARVYDTLSIQGSVRPPVVATPSILVVKSSGLDSPVGQESLADTHHVTLSGLIEDVDVEVSGDWTLVDTSRVESGLLVRVRPFIARDSTEVQQLRRGAILIHGQWEGDPAVVQLLALQ